METKKESKPFNKDKGFKGKKNFKHKPRHNEAMNKQMSEKLSALFEKTQAASGKPSKPKFFGQKFTVKPLRQEAVDGVDHINFFVNTETQLGALLSTACRLPFKYQYYIKNADTGEMEVHEMQFESLKCFWAYMRTGCYVSEFNDMDDSRITANYRSINEFPKQDSIFAALMNAYYQRFEQYPELKEAFLANKLPLEYYSIRDGLKQRSKVSQLMITGLYEIKRALSSNTKPKLDGFLSSEDRDQAFKVMPNERYEYIIQNLISPMAFLKRASEALTTEQAEELVAKLRSRLVKKKPVAKPEAPVQEAKPEEVKQEKPATQEGFTLLSSEEAKVKAQEPNKATEQNEGNKVAEQPQEETVVIPTENATEVVQIELKQATAQEAIQEANKE